MTMFTKTQIGLPEVGGFEVRDGFAGSVRALDYSHNCVQFRWRAPIVCPVGVWEGVGVVVVYCVVWPPP